LILQKAEAFEEGVAGGDDDDAQAHRPPEATLVRAEGMSIRFMPKAPAMKVGGSSRVDRIVRH